MSYEEIRASYPRAKKEYRCEWCNEAITIGEKHLSRAYKFDGYFRSARMHLECENAMTKYPDDLDGWSPGQFKRGEFTTKQ
jgi:hypothetical protein